MRNSLVFVGALELSRHALVELIEHGASPDLIVTLRPNLQHRHSDFADLRGIAREHGIPVELVDNVNDAHVIARMRAADPDYVFVIGWSQLLGADLLRVPKLGAIGFHFSRLPKNRGRAALAWAILNEEQETGATLLHLDEGVDSGDIVAQRTIALGRAETARSLYDKVCAELRAMMRDVAAAIREGRPLPAVPQDHAEATYLAKRVADDGFIDWSRSAEDIDRLIRAVGEPYPGAFTVYRDRRVIVWKARPRPTFNQIGSVGQILARDEESVVVQCGEGWLDLLSVQAEGEHEAAPAAELFTRMHDKLGVDAHDLWRRVRRLEQSAAAAGGAR